MISAFQQSSEKKLHPNFIKAAISESILKMILYSFQETLLVYSNTLDRPDWQQKLIKDTRQV